MANPTANGPNTLAAAARPGGPPGGADRPADPAAAAREGAHAAAEMAGRSIEAERRTFEENTQNATRAASGGLNAAASMARQGAQATRQLADDGRRAGLEIANVWREAWDPLFKAQMEATRWIDETWRQFTGLSAFPALQTARPFAISPAGLFGAPPADLRETDNAYEIAIETPGMAREDLNLKVEGDSLTICGQKLDRRDQATSAYRLSERRFGRFSRSFPIPPDARREAIDAKHQDGVLTITLPKSEEARQQAKRIEIH